MKFITLRQELYINNVKVIFKEQGDFFILQGTDGLYICMIWPAGHRDEEKCFKLKDDDLIKYPDCQDMVFLAKEIRSNYKSYKAQEVPVPEF
ncbi:hypothetical protein SAMN05192562_107166 [Kosakonia arachidis]|uniref:Uncharacterized protein n=1 Tax=Kosakonia arachidis TaxID=551989 RepID=A0A1I7DY95_9ENTR|nr:hypothetical protein [Kosakonia arachidis]SFU16586.1 hypothetical protein SAMN05192562_107166 [Kosakonia arachidis]